jgi:hypothetical protein
MSDIDELISLAKRKSPDAEAVVSKKKKKKSHKQDTHSANGAGHAPDSHSAVSDYPYPVVPDDHCESPLEAYQDISCFLSAIAESLGKGRGELRIFDPYFCEGSMKKRLAALGFTNVYNEKKDFYESIRTNSLPEYDVLVTNPPYSGEHMERLLRFCTAQDASAPRDAKPWFLLLPNYVYTKDYYALVFGTNGAGAKHGIGFSGKSHVSDKQSASTALAPFYVTPAGTRRYLYTTPKGRRQEKSSKYTSPFPTFWYCQVYR